MLWLALLDGCLPAFASFVSARPLFQRLAPADPIANQNLAFKQRDLIISPNGNSGPVVLRGLQWVGVSFLGKSGVLDRLASKRPAKRTTDRRERERGLTDSLPARFNFVLSTRLALATPRNRSWKAVDLAFGRVLLGGVGCAAENAEWQKGVAKAPADQAAWSAKWGYPNDSTIKALRSDPQQTAKNPFLGSILLGTLYMERSRILGARIVLRLLWLLREHMLQLAL